MIKSWWEQNWMTGCILVIFSFIVIEIMCRTSVNQDMELEIQKLNRKIDVTYILINEVNLKFKIINIELKRHEELMNKK